MIHTVTGSRAVNPVVSLLVVSINSIGARRRETRAVPVPAAIVTIESSRTPVMSQVWAEPCDPQKQMATNFMAGFTQRIPIGTHDAARPTTASRRLECRRAGDDRVPRRVRKPGRWDYAAARE